MARMRDIKEAAQKNRAKLLKQFESIKAKDSEFTVTEFAEKFCVTRAWISKQLIRARKESK